MRGELRAKGMALFEVLTVGFPFCGFKILAGLSLSGPAATPPARMLGALLVALGVLDIAINGANLAGLLASGRRLAPACLLSLVASSLRGSSRSTQGWQELGNSLDVLVSFVLVAVMIGAGRIGSLSAHRLAAWNACVILNVLGAGLGRFGHSVLDLNSKPL